MTATNKKNVDFNAQTALDIDAARHNAKLNVAAVRTMINGGERAWKARERVVAILSSDPVFDKSQRHHLSWKETSEKFLSIQNRFDELRQTYHWDERDISFAYKALDEPLPISVHDDVFAPVVMAQGSEELKAKFGPLIMNRGILGCYLQTELGHGSSVAQLETTATYIPESEEFEIHSPTITSTKWWAGALGSCANFGVVQARLILPGNNDMGPHLFFVQLRSMDTHEALPHIKIGDIGPKAMGGYATMDNGYARFDHLRIPRFQMLSKFAQVTKEGKYVKPSHPKLSYGSMLKVRSSMVRTAATALARAATISIRYATVRRQGSLGEDRLERQIISYPSVHCRLLPILSRAFVYAHLYRDVERSYVKFSKQLDRGDTSLLPEMHAITSGLKVLVTTSTVRDIEDARRSMGGHGYSAYADLGRVYANYLPGPTFEGDNYVLDQQVVRAAMKAYSQPPSDTYSSFNAYIRLLHGGRADTLGAEFEAPDWADSQVVINILEWRAAKAVQAQAVSQKEGAVDASSDKRVSQAVSEAYVATQVGEMRHSMGRAGIGKESETIIKSLLHLYLLSTAEAAVADLLSLNIISAKGLGGKKAPTEMLRLELSRCCAQLVPEAVSLSDCFGYSDWELNSAAGVYDGRVYDEFWHRAQTEPLNQTEVTGGYKDFIKPLLERGRARISQEFTSKL